MDKIRPIVEEVVKDIFMRADQWYFKIPFFKFSPAEHVQIRQNLERDYFRRQNNFSHILGTWESKTVMTWAPKGV
jgi:hypothetical protein